MAGGLMQLVAYGAQDVYLTANPQITFWKVTYRRYTNFAMESIEQTFNGQADFGRRVQCTISRNGDLAYRTYLEVTLPEVTPDSTTNGTANARWLDYPGEQLINLVEVEIGGQYIDRQYGQWMHIWNQLTMTKEQEAGYHKMIGHTTQLTYLTSENYTDVNQPCSESKIGQVCEPRNSLPETTLYIPLQFWFCRNPGLALPLIALQYHEVKINIELNPINKCLWQINAAGEATDQSYNLSNASLFVDYIFLDTDERRRMAQNPHEYLIEQVQFTGDESVGSSANKVRLNFNHPCKELIWTVQKDDLIGDCSSDIDKVPYGPQYFNYTDAADVLPRAMFNYLPYSLNSLNSDVADENASDVKSTLIGAGEDDKGNKMKGTRIGDNNAYNDESLTPYDNTTLSNNQQQTPASAWVTGEVSRGLHCWGENPVVTAKLQLNGQDRFSEREGSYFDVVQPFQHHTRHPDTGINVYSFALRPEEHQPSGTCNFSRIDNATLQLVLSSNAVNSANSCKVRIYAVNYNVLRVMSGMGGLAYSN
jgi:hypothetical protein